MFHTDEIKKKFLIKIHRELVFFFSFFTFFIIILLYCRGHIVTFTKVLVIYHSLEISLFFFGSTGV
jgi:hypothetical protein